MNTNNKISQEMIDISGVSTSVKQRMNEGPVLICIHGSGLSQQTYAPLWGDPRMTGYSFITYDLPGHGESEPPCEPEKTYSYPGYSRHLSTLIKTLNIENFIIIGHSMGGHIALQSAANSGLPGMLGLILLGVAPMRSIQDLAATFRQPSKPAPKPEEATPEEMAEYLAALFERREEAQPDLIKAILSAEPASKTWFMKNMSKFEIEDEISYIRKSNLPIWMATGEDDPIVNPEYMKSPSIQKLTGPNKRIKLLANRDHMPVWDEPGAHSDILLEFLNLYT